MRRRLRLSCAGSRPRAGIASRPPQTRSQRFGSALLARQAYLEHNRAWQAYLDRAARDAAEFALPQDEVNSTFLAAEPYFREAIPEPDGYSLSERIDLIFAEPEPESGPTQQASLSS